MLVGVLQLSLQLLYSHLHLIYDLHLFIYILHWLVLDLLGFAGVFESAEVFFQVVIAWVDASNHDSERVASNTLLQKRSQLRVSVGNVLFLLRS